jgi:hypothetical protein
VSLRGRRPIETLRSVPLVAYPAAATVAVTALDGGGFEPGSQTLLIVLAGLTLLAAAQSEGTAILAAARSPLIVSLGLLGALSVLSGLWTIGDPGVAARWGLVILSYGAIAVSGAVLAARTGPWPIAAGVAVLAGVEAVLGLAAAALHSLPNAEWIDGSWRPGGTFQYPPALGLLELAALPVFLAALLRVRSLALAAAAGAVLAGAMLGCADSRLDLGLAVVVLALAVLWPPGGKGRRRELVAAAGLFGLAALDGHLVLGGHVTATQGGGDLARLGLITCACLALALAWLPIRALVRGQLGTRIWLTGLGLVTVALAVGAVAVVILPQTARRTMAVQGGITHGRLHQLEAAFQTWLDRPWVGAGTGTYYQASAIHQGSSPTLFAHDLPLEEAAELGVLGFLLAVAMYVSTATVINRARASPSLWLLAPGVAAFLIANLLDWPWHLPGLAAVWAVAAGGLVAAAPPVKRHPGVRPWARGR